MTQNLIGSFDLVFRPSVNLISVVRRFVQNFYEHFLDGDAGAQLALATHELLENAVKYSTDGEARLSIAVAKGNGKHEVSIGTKNRASPEHLATLHSLFGELESSPDGFTFYQTLMKRSAKDPVRSGLGLARIVAEADMDLRHQVHGDELHVYGRCVVVAKEAS